MRQARLKVIKQDISSNMCFAEITCELVCKPSVLCNWITDTRGVKEYLVDLSEHSVGLWHSIKLQAINEIDPFNSEYMFTFGKRVNGENVTILTLFLDCRCKKVRFCGMPEVVYAFLNWANGETKFNSLLDEYRKAVLRP